MFPAPDYSTSEATRRSILNAIVKSGSKEDMEDYFSGRSPVVLVSSIFSCKFGVGPGQMLTLDCPQGTCSFKVADVVKDYSSPEGGGSISANI